MKSITTVCLTISFLFFPALSTALPPQLDATTAEALLAPWFHSIEVRDGEVERGPVSALLRECYLKSPATAATDPVNNLGPALADLEQALALDPSYRVARYTLGTILIYTGRPLEGVTQLEQAIADLADTAPGFDPLVDAMRKRALFSLVEGYRSLGRWDKALAAVRQARELKPSRALDVMEGLCLGGSGQTAEAIRFAVRLPPLAFQHRTSLSIGQYPRPSDFANRWIKSQALLAEGNLQGARHVLGELKTIRARRRLPFYRQFWQDAGFIFELLHDPEALDLYNMVAWRPTLGLVYPPRNLLLPPEVLGFPAATIPVFITPDDGFAGGSPFGYLAWQEKLITDAPGSEAAAIAQARGLEMCDALLRRHVQADLVRAFRARIYLAADQPELAYPELVFAQAGFKERGLTDAGTSILLGHQELLLSNNARAEELFAEAVAATPDNADAWRELGVALGRAGDFARAQKAMDRAVELEPDSLEGWFNLGILAYQHHEYERALAHLEKAWALAPGNQRVQTMLQTVATAQRNEKVVR